MQRTIEHGIELAAKSRQRRGLNPAEVTGPFEGVGIANDVGGSPVCIGGPWESFEEAVKTAVEQYESLLGDWQGELLDVCLYNCRRELIWMLTGI